MTYSSDFLANEDSARNLVLEAGYSSAAAISAATKLAELCIYVGLVRKMASEHVKGENLPSHFEAEISVNPIKLRGSTTVDLLQNLEEGNVLVSRSSKYRVMLSNLMNRVFSLTASSGEASIRSDVEKLHDNETFIDALDTIEWELVSGIHENIDLKYLDVDSLAENKIPRDLLLVMGKIDVLASLLRQNEIDLDETSEHLVKSLTKGSAGKENIQILRDYLQEIGTLSDVLSAEGTKRWEIVRGASAYPRSLLNRSGPPLIKSSWHLKPDFRNHPLIMKYQDFMGVNQESISDIVSTYEGHISQVIDRISHLPRGTSLISILREKDDTIPSSETMNERWNIVDKHGPGLRAQSKLLGRLVSNIDVLFEQKD